MKTSNWNNKVKNNYNDPKKHYKNSYKDHTDNRLSGTKIEVWNDDVNQALKKLKKVLENDNRQKDLAKHEYYEKPSVKRKRARDVAKSRWRRKVDTSRNQGNWVDSLQADSSWLKSKRKRRKHVTLVEKIKNRKKG